MRGGMIAVLILFGLVTGQACMAEDSGKVASVTVLVKNIKLSYPPERVSLAYKLEDLIWNMDRSELDMINRNTIDEIESMLSDSNEGAIYAAALALGHIGKPASNTVPALLKALKEVEDSHRRPPVRPGGVDANDAIVSALIKLKACVPPPPPFDTSVCDYLLH